MVKGGLELAYGQRSLTIGYDCDDVLIPFAERTVDYYNETYSANVDVAHYYDDAKYWGVDDISIASERVKKYMKEYAHKYLLVPDAEAVVAVRGLSRIHKGLLVTGRDDYMEPITRKMADTYFTDCFQKIIHTNHYCENACSKGSVCIEEDVDILIDDGLMHCESAVEEGGVEAALLFDRPWNQNRVLHPRIIRCENWDRIRYEVGRIASIRL